MVTQGLLSVVLLRSVSLIHSFPLVLTGRKLRWRSSWPAKGSWVGGVSALPMWTEWVHGVPFYVLLVSPFSSLSLNSSSPSFKSHLRYHFLVWTGWRASSLPRRICAWLCPCPSWCQGKYHLSTSLMFLVSLAPVPVTVTGCSVTKCLGQAIWIFWTKLFLNWWEVWVRFTNSIAYRPSRLV